VLTGPYLLAFNNKDEMTPRALPNNTQPLFSIQQLALSSSFQNKNLKEIY